VGWIARHRFSHLMLLLCGLLPAGCDWKIDAPPLETDDDGECYSESCRPVHVDLVYPAWGDTVAGQVTVRFTAWGPDGLTGIPEVSYRQWLIIDSIGPTPIEPVRKMARRTYEAPWDTRNHPDGLGTLEICARSRKGGDCRRFMISIGNVH